MEPSLSEVYEINKKLEKYKNYTIIIKNKKVILLNKTINLALLYGFSLLMSLISSLWIV